MKVENVKVQKNIWSVDVDGNSIRVENKSTELKLFVNDKLQDIYNGLYLNEHHFTGKLLDGKDIKVSFGGVFKFHCYIFVDNELVLEG